MLLLGRVPHNIANKGFPLFEKLLDFLAAVATTTDDSLEILKGKRCWVCNKSVKERYQAKDVSIPSETKGYQLDTTDNSSLASQPMQVSASEICSKQGAAAHVRGL